MLYSSELSKFTATVHGMWDYRVHVQYPCFRSSMLVWHCRYKLLLEVLLKETPTSHNDHAAVAAALREVEPLVVSACLFSPCLNGGRGGCGCSALLYPLPTICIASRPSAIEWSALICVPCSYRVRACVLPRYIFLSGVFSDFLGP